MSDLLFSFTVFLLLLFFFPHRVRCFFVLFFCFFFGISSILDGLGLRTKLHLGLFHFTIVEPMCTMVGTCKDMIGVCRYTGVIHRSMQGDSSAGPS